MQTPLWLPLAVVILTLPVGAPMSCREWETRRMSIYAYSSNKLMSNHVKKVCSSKEQQCDKAFDGSSTDGGGWKPSNNDNRPTTTITNVTGINRMVAGRIRCEDCAHYLNQQVEVTNGVVVTKAFIVADPFDSRGDGWYRFDVPNSKPTGNNITFAFPEKAKDNDDPKFIEIEGHTPSNLNIKRYSNKSSGRSLYSIHTYKISDDWKTPDNPLVLVRLMVEALDDVIDTSVNVTIQTQDSQGKQTTLLDGTLDVPAMEAGDYSPAMLQELDRITDIQQINISIVAAASLTPTLELFSDTAKYVDYTDVFGVTATCPPILADKMCDKVIDNDSDKALETATIDTIITLDLLQKRRIRRIRLKQENIKEMDISLDNNKCTKIRFVETPPSEASEWLMVQLPEQSKSVEFKLTDRHDTSADMKIYEIEIYGPDDGTTPAPPTTPSTKPTTTSTTSTPITDTTMESTSQEPTPTSQPTTSNTPSPTTSDGTSPTSTTQEPTTSSESATFPPATSAPPATESTTSETVETTTESQSNTTGGENSTTAVPGTSPTTTTLSTSTTTTVRPTTPPPKPFPGRTATWEIDMKIKGEQFYPGMGEEGSQEYWGVFDIMYPMVSDAINGTEPARYLGVYNVSFSNGSIDMRYMFNLSGTDDINEDVLTSNIRRVFNASGYTLGNISVSGPTLSPQAIENILAVALATAIVCLVVVVTIITVLCLKRRCQQQEEHAEADIKDSDTYSGHPAGSFPNGNRVWQSGLASFHPNLPFDGIEMVRRSEDDQNLFEYPGPSTSTVTQRGGYTPPDIPGSHGEDLDYWDVQPGVMASDDTPEGFDPPPLFAVPSQNVLPQRHYQRHESYESNQTFLTGNTVVSSDELEVVSLDEMVVPSTSRQQALPDLVPDQPNMPRSLQESLSNESSNIVLPKFYRDRQDTDQSGYSGYFVSPNDVDAFEMPKPNPMDAFDNSAVGPKTHGLRRTESDSLDPQHYLPFSIDTISLPDDLLSSTLSDDMESTDSITNQDIPGFDDALKPYWSDPKKDDRSIIQRILSSRKAKPDMVHRTVPVYDMKRSLKIKEAK